MRGAGTAVITATAADGSGISASCTISVNKKPQIITWEQNELDKLIVGDKLDLNAVASSNLEVRFESSNPTIAEVFRDYINGPGNFCVNCLAVGEVTITASQAGDDKYLAAESVVKTLTINPKLVSEITLDKTTAEGFIGETIQLIATVSPDDATNPAVVWTSDNEVVATVSESGLVTLIAEGVANIIVTAADDSGVSATCEVTVKEELGIESITVDARVKVENGEIVVSGVADDAIVEVYNIDGQLVYAGTDRRIALAAHNVYFVKIEGKTYKVIL